MTKKKNILFIINPISGVGKQKIVEKAIEQYLDEELFDYSIAYTEYAGHAKEITKENKKEYEIIVAVGGDGSVNEVGSQLIHCETSMGIIPTGSGNGLARHLKIPLKIKNAIQNLNQSRIDKIDTIQANDTIYLNMAGIGFDAHIAHLFDNYGKRGFISYIKIIAKEFFKYQNKEYHLQTSEKEINTKAFIISLANSTQYGNNGHIAPLANIKDGLIDVCIVKKFPIYLFPFLAIHLFLKTAHKSKYITILKTRQLTLSYKNDLQGHYDGEPTSYTTPVHFKILPASLKVMTGFGFSG
ncbi:MAG: diacylglycerol kinase [Marinilabiliales bacterium]|nr:MAG: diacylglycerol kinase [Marinilabiliales bacterium]